MVMAADIAARPLQHPAGRRITVLGSTGSIGCNTLDLLRHSDAFQVRALTAHRNVQLLAAQAREFDAEIAVVCDHAAYRGLKDALAGTPTEVAAGPEAVADAAAAGADVVVAAIVGAAGIEATYRALSGSPAVAIANKECLVAAGDLIKREAARAGATLLPVDSEHSAVFQVLDRERLDSVEKIILTASGGPFRTWPLERMRSARPQDALKHPNWEMGAKVTIDSATMMNKGLELIEARHLFDIGEERLEVLIHPQSIVHSLVAYHDGSVLAQLGEPDMRTPISVALAWPERMPAPVAPLDLARIGSLTFEPADPERFPALGLARSALGAGAGAPVVLNAANEIAVEAFLAGRIGFLDIAATVEKALARAGTALAGPEPATIADVLDLDAAARRVTHELLATT